MPLFGRRDQGPVPEWAAALSESEFATFRKHLTAALKRRGGHELRDGYVRVPGNPMQMGLTNLLQQWRLCDPSGRAALVADHFERLLEAEDADALGRDELLACLRPRLWNSTDLAQVNFALLKRPVTDGLEVVLAVDLPRTVRNLQPEQAQSTGWSESELWDIARGQIDDGLPIETETITDDVEVVLGDSVFVTSRLLDLERHLGPMPASGALVAVPHRHMLLCHRIRSVSAVAALRRMIPMAADFYRQGPGSLVDHVYWWQPDGSLTLIPTQITDREVNIMAPDEFVEMLNAFESPAETEGYELVFWRHDSAERSDPNFVYRALREGESVPGVRDFPIDTFLGQLSEKWDRFAREEDVSGRCVYRVSPVAVVEIEWGERHVAVTLRPLDKDLANEVIDAAAFVDAPLYDPQTDERFDGLGS